MSQIPPPFPQPQMYAAPHRGVLILIFGIISLTVCAPFGIAAWLMGSSDLKRMKAGTMDPEGKGLTMGGMICGIIASVLLILGIVFYVFLFLILGIGAAAGAGSP